jgi:hypothetical protein
MNYKASFKRGRFALDTPLWTLQIQAYVSSCDCYSDTIGPAVLPFFVRLTDHCIAEEGSVFTPCTGTIGETVSECSLSSK